MCAPGPRCRAQFDQGPAEGALRAAGRTGPRVHWAHRPPPLQESLVSFRGECSLVLLTDASKLGKRYLPTSTSLSKQPKHHRRTKLQAFVWAKTHLETMNNEEETGGGREEKEGSTDANSAKKNYLRSNFPKRVGVK